MRRPDATLPFAAGLRFAAGRIGAEKRRSRAQRLQIHRFQQVRTLKARSTDSWSARVSSTFTKCVANTGRAEPPRSRSGLSRCARQANAAPPCPLPAPRATPEYPVARQSLREPVQAPFSVADSQKLQQVPIPAPRNRRRRLDRLSCVSARIELVAAHSLISTLLSCDFHRSVTSSGRRSSSPRRPVQTPLTLFPLAPPFADNRNWGLGSGAENLANSFDHSRHRTGVRCAARRGNKREGAASPRGPQGNRGVEP